MTNANSQIFDAAADSYDDTFTNSMIGKAQRKRVYHWLNKVDFFNSKNKVFEINCGTGFDAEHFYNKGLDVIATDGSRNMIEVAKQKRNAEIDFFQLKFSDVSKDEKFKQSNILFSNFGGLNCLSKEALQKFSNDVAANQKKDDLIAWVIMPKQCMIESFFFMLKGQFKKGFRRNTNEALIVNVDGEEVETFYHSPNDVKNILSPKYQVILKKPVALFLPPSYLESFFKNKKFIFNTLAFFEKIFGSISYYSSFSDHYIIIAKKL